MILDLQNRDIDYLNNSDTFMCYDAGIKNMFLSKLHFDKGSWWTNESLKYKATTILIQNTSELYNKEITYEEISTYKGTIIKFLEPKNIGIIWDSGKQIKEFGLGPYWNKLKTLNLIIP